MYEYILRTLPQPATYEQWRTAAIDQQRVYVHMRNRADRFKTKKLPPITTWRPFGNQWKNPQQGSKRHGYVTRTNASSSSRGRRFPPRRKSDTNNEWEEAGKGDTQEDPYRGTDKGKSSHVSFAESPVTLQGIADRNKTIEDQAVPLATRKYLRALDKFVKRTATFE
jgi:hypothetical protein